MSESEEDSRGEESASHSASPLGSSSFEGPLSLKLHGVVNAHAHVRNYIVVGERFPPDRVHVSQFRNGVRLELGTAIARRLAKDPTALRYRFGT